MSAIKKVFKKNTHNKVFKALAGFGRSLNRMYENRNHDIESNGESIVLKKISKFNPSVIFDGGANVGDYSKTVNKLIPDCKIFAFEPVESTYQILRSNTTDIEKIIPVKKGLYKENGLTEINVFDSNEHSSLYNIQGLEVQSDKKTTIDLIRGDDFVKKNNIDSIDFLKLDIEGAEYDALLGFNQSLTDGKIKAIQFEYGYINISTKRLLVDYHELLESKGYIVGKIYPKVVEFRKYLTKHEDFIGPNFIAVKKTEIELIKSLSSR